MSGWHHFEVRGAAFLLALVPPIVVLLYLLVSGEARGFEARRRVFRAFATGFLVVIPVGCAEFSFRWALGPLEARLPHGLAMAMLAFGVFGALEEGGKWWAARRVARTAIGTERDAIVYAMAVGLGFACLEGLVYWIGDARSAPIRMMTSVPMHAIAAGLMGSELGRASLARERAIARRHLTRSLLVPLAFHGAYDALLLASGLWWAATTPLLLGGLFWVRWRWRRELSEGTRRPGSEGPVRPRG